MATAVAPSPTAPSAPHLNYRIEHHMFSSVPFYNLHKLRAAIAADLPPAPRGLLRTWAQMLPILWRQRHDAGWVMAPPLPALPA